MLFVICLEIWVASCLINFIPKYGQETSQISVLHENDIVIYKSGQYIREICWPW